MPTRTNIHILTASERFKAVFGSCRDAVSQHADHVDYVLYLKTCLLSEELSRGNIQTIYRAQANKEAIF